MIDSMKDESAENKLGPIMFPLPPLKSPMTTPVKSKKKKKKGK